MNTQGPWELVFGKNGKEEEFVVYAPDDGTICRGDDEMVGFRDNARLIAAAPELLEALEACSEGLECVANTEGQSGCNHCIARTALAKAKGEVLNK